METPEITSPPYNPTSPPYNPTSPPYNPTSPDEPVIDYIPITPDYVPITPDYMLNSPPYNPTSPIYGPVTPDEPAMETKKLDINGPVVEPEILDAINIFFKLKGKYENDIKKMKKKILKRVDLNEQEKRDMFQTLKPKCVICKNEGGTIFKTEPERYLAMCNAEPKCRLDIRITRGSVVHLDEYVKELKEQHSELVTSIMKIKYNLLFKYSDEEIAVKAFESTKNNFDTIATAFDLYKTKLIDISNLLSRKEKINLTELQIFEFVKEIKELVTEAKNESNPQYLKDSVELYINRLMEALKENRESKYRYQAVEKDESGSYQLVQKATTIEDLEVISGGSFKVESLSIKK